MEYSVVFIRAYALRKVGQYSTSGLLLSEKVNFELNSCFKNGS